MLCIGCSKIRNYIVRRFFVLLLDLVVVLWELVLLYDVGWCELLLLLLKMFCVWV